MTDVSKYKSVALSHASCDKLDKIRRVVVPEVEVSRAKALDILINGTMIAKGEVVMVGERFGIRFVEIVDPQKRIESVK